MNKRGGIIGVIIVIGVLFLLVIGGILMAFGGVVVTWVFDEAVPELSGLGVIGDANMTAIAGSTLAPVNTIVQSFTWLFGVFYTLALLSCFAMAFVFRTNGNRWLAGLFIGFVILLVIASIFVSNIYEEFYNDGSEVGVRLHEFTTLSFLILYSPVIMSVIALVCGIIMFTGSPEEGVV